MVGARVRIKNGKFSFILALRKLLEKYTSFKTFF